MRGGDPRNNPDHAWPKENPTDDDIDTCLSAPKGRPGNAWRAMHSNLLAK